jgi:hypothetical protein
LELKRLMGLIKRNGMVKVRRREISLGIERDK